VKKAKSSVLMSSEYAQKCIAALVDLQRIFCGHCPRPAMERQSPYADLALYTLPVFERPHGLIMEPPMCYCTVYSVSFTDNLT